MTTGTLRVGFRPQTFHFPSEILSNKLIYQLHIREFIFYILLTGFKSTTLCRSVRFMPEPPRGILDQ